MEAKITVAQCEVCENELYYAADADEEEIEQFILDKNWLPLEQSNMWVCEKCAMKLDLAQELKTEEYWDCKAEKRRER